MPGRARNRIEPISPRMLYPLEVFKERTGLGDAAMRTLRRGGLEVRYVGGRGFVYGQDFIRYALRTHQADADLNQLAGSAWAVGQRLHSVALQNRENISDDAADAFHGFRSGLALAAQEATRKLPLSLSA